MLYWRVCQAFKHLPKSHINSLVQANSSNRNLIPFPETYTFPRSKSHFRLLHHKTYVDSFTNSFQSYNAVFHLLNIIHFNLKTILAAKRNYEILFRKN